MVDFQSFKSLIVTGCSFTAGSSNIDNAYSQPTTWPHFFLRKNTNFRQFINLAIPGGGNIAASSNLTLFLEQENPSPDTTLILFNITGMDRYDVMCEINHVYANQHFSWNRVLDTDWITTGGFNNQKIDLLSNIQKNMGYRSIQKMSMLSTMSMIHYLEHRKYTYAFMIMGDNVLVDLPEWFHRFLDQYKEKYITFDGLNMFEFCKLKNLISEDRYHPTVEGYETLSGYIETHLNSQ